MKIQIKELTINGTSVNYGDPVQVANPIEAQKIIYALEEKIHVQRSFYFVEIKQPTLNELMKQVVKDLEKLSETLKQQTLFCS